MLERCSRVLTAFVKALFILLTSRQQPPEIMLSMDKIN